MYPEFVEVLDTYCGAGGCSVGYDQALTEAGIPHRITGVDIKPQKHYPVPYRFILGDALEYLAAYGANYDFIHASPPCQGYSRMRHLPWLKGRKYELLIEPTREILAQLNKPYVIENVSDSPLNGAELCGMALGLRLIRHRRFECNPLVLFPPCPGHPVVFSGVNTMSKRGQNGGVMGVIDGNPKKALEIDWMTQREMRQAVPPAYTRLIMRQWLAQQEAR